MAENIRVGWLHDHGGMKFAPKTLSTQILNTDGTSYKTAVDGTIAQINERIDNLTDTTKVTAGNGLTGGGSAASDTGVTLNVGAGNGITVDANAVSAKAGTGITVDTNGIHNAGVRSIATGTTNGTISVNTGGTTADVAVKGLGSNAYTSTAYLPLTGGTLTGGLTINAPTTEESLTIVGDDNIYPSIVFADRNGNYDPVYIQYEMDTQTVWVGGDTSVSGDITANTITGTKVVGAVWNDYAEYRESNITEPGRVICENGDDTLSLANERLQPGANVISDTFGFAIGETEKAKTPIAVSGRVLVYTFEARDTYKPGDAVCAAPGGTVSRMSRKEIMTYPERIIGTVSAIPSYETWGEKNVPVNGRIWIKVK